MRSSGAVVLGVAIVWAAVVIACALVLKGTECFERILPLLGGGAAGTIVVVGGGTRRKKQGPI